MAPLDKSGHYGNLDETQKETLKQFEAQLGQDGLLPDPLLKEEEQRQTVLL